jgi:hypothetical protein
VNGAAAKEHTIVFGQSGTFDVLAGFAPRQHPGWQWADQGRPQRTGVRKMSNILLIIVILLLVGALPTWPYSSGWGYYPSGGLGVVLIVLVVLLVLGRL